MRILKKTSNLKWLMKRMVDLANKSSCNQHPKCGSVVVALEHIIIGEGYNGSPHELIKNYTKRKTDPCCVPADQAAIIDAFQGSDKGMLDGASLFIIQLDDDGIPINEAWNPYRDISMKMALDVGIVTFRFYRDGRWVSYDVDEYNEMIANRNTSDSLDTNLDTISMYLSEYGEC